MWKYGKIRSHSDEKKCGISARIDIYDMDIHAFDMLRPGWEVSKRAAHRFNEEFYYASEHYFAE